MTACVAGQQWPTAYLIAQYQKLKQEPLLLFHRSDSHVDPILPATDSIPLDPDPPTHPVAEPYIPPVVADRDAYAAYQQIHSMPWPPPHDLLRRAYGYDDTRRRVVRRYLTPTHDDYVVELSLDQRIGRLVYFYRFLWYFHHQAAIPPRSHLRHRAGVTDFHSAAPEDLEIFTRPAPKSKQERWAQANKKRIGKKQACYFDRLAARMKNERPIEHTTWASLYIYRDGWLWHRYLSRRWFSSDEAFRYHNCRVAGKSAVRTSLSGVRYVDVAGYTVRADRVVYSIVARRTLTDDDGIVHLNGLVRDIQFENLWLISEKISETDIALQVGLLERAK